MEKTICVFGDSTAWGAWDEEKGGWVNRLWLSLVKKNHTDDYYVEVCNLSISGGTTETILARFESEAKIREANVLIFQSGGNDSYLTGKDGPNHISLDKFKQNVEEIIVRARNITKEIVFIGFKNVDESRTAPVSWKDIYYLNTQIKKYDEAMREICDRNSVLYMDTFGLLRNEDFDDGLHPNANGHEKLFQSIRVFLEKNKII